jgi:hypothetical protein
MKTAPGIIHINKGIIMTQKASETQIKAFNQRKSNRSFKELGSELMISPMLLEQFALGLQFQNEVIFDKIVQWIEGKNPQPPVG